MMPTKLSDRDRSIGPVFRVEIQVAGEWKAYRRNGRLFHASEARRALDRLTRQGRMARIVVPAAGRVDSTNHAEITKLFSDNLAAIYTLPVK